MRLFCIFSQLIIQERLEEQSVSNDEAESGDTESLEALKAELERRDNSLRNTQEERDTLMSELEELDRQNQEATQVRLTTVALLYYFIHNDK